MRIILIIAIIFMAGSVYAGETELIEEQRTLFQRLQEYRQVITNIEIRLIEIQGALKYTREKPAMTLENIQTPQGVSPHTVPMK